MDELREGPAADRFRVLGSRHSFNAIADTDGDLISLGPAATRRRDRPRRVHGHRRRRHPLRRPRASPRRGRAGARQPRVAAAHLGRGGVRHRDPRVGRPQPTLAGAVRAVELLRGGRRDLATSTATPIPARSRGSPCPSGRWASSPRLTLDVLPRYDVEQAVYEDLPLTRSAGGSTTCSRRRTASACSRRGETTSWTRSGSSAGSPPGSVPRGRGRSPCPLRATRPAGGPPSGSGHGPGRVHRAARRARAVARAPAALPPRPQAERRRRAPERVVRRRSHVVDAFDALYGAPGPDVTAAARRARSARSPPTTSG